MIPKVQKNCLHQGKNHVGKMLNELSEFYNPNLLSFQDPHVIGKKVLHNIMTSCIIMHDTINEDNEISVHGLEMQDQHHQQTFKLR